MGKLMKTWLIELLVMFIVYIVCLIGDDILTAIFVEYFHLFKPNYDFTVPVFFIGGMIYNEWYNSRKDIE